jgi:hypothetical protein
MSSETDSWIIKAVSSKLNTSAVSNPDNFSEIESLKRKNKELQHAVTKLINKDNPDNPEPIQPKTTEYKLMDLLLNATKKRIYEPTLKKFAAFIYLRAGRRAYSTLCANLPLPKESTICKFIHSGESLKILYFLGENQLLNLNTNFYFFCQNSRFISILFGTLVLLLLFNLEYSTFLTDKVEIRN